MHPHSDFFEANMLYKKTYTHSVLSSANQNAILNHKRVLLPVRQDEMAARTPVQKVS
jgi:hypothetical protein